MAQRTGIWQVTGEKELFEQLTFYKMNVPTAMEDAIVDAAEQGTLVMVERVRTATTKTGEERVAGASSERFIRSPTNEPVSAGRIETGAMITSIYDTWLGETADSFRANVNRGGNFMFRFGWVAAPDYTTFQESGTRKGINGMFALQAGWNVVNKVLFDYMARRAEQATNAALARHYYKRAKRTSIKGISGWRRIGA